MASQTKRPRRLRFSIAALLLLVTAASVWLGYLTWAPRRQRELVQAVQSIGGAVVREAEDPFDVIPTPKAKPEVEPTAMEQVANLLDGKPEQITYVSFRNRPISDDELQSLWKLPHVEELDLLGTNISDAGLVHVGRLTQLRKLNLSKTNIGDEGLAHLAGLTHLESLALPTTRISDDGLIHLRGLNRLEGLLLDGTAVSDRGLEHLKNLPLRILSLGVSEVRGPGLRHLAGHTELQSINLEGTEIAPEHLIHFASLPKLIWLSINIPELTDDAITSLQELKLSEGLIVGGPAIDSASLSELQASLPYRVTSRRSPP